jgi:hypothetical protein
LVSSLRADPCAPTIAAPLLSAICPIIWPLFAAACAHAGAGADTRPHDTINAAATNRHILILSIPSLR